MNSRRLDFMTALLTLACLLVAAVAFAKPTAAPARMASSTLPISSTNADSASSSPSDVVDQNDDDDGDDDVNELTYSWQNPRYSRDERRQMGYILVVLGSLSLYGIARRPQRPAPRTEQS